MNFGFFSPTQVFADFFQEKNIKSSLEVLAQKMLEGHVCLDLQSKDAAHQFSDQNLIQELEQSALVGDGLQPTPFVLHQGKLYTHRNFSYESSFIQKIIALCNQEDLALRIEKLSEMKSLVDSLFSVEDKSPPNRIDWQKIACLCSFLHRFSIITGGPGTGKTTTVSKLLMLFLSENPNYKVVMAAPTGKAASRMRESLIHSLSFAPERISPAIIDIIKSLESSTLHRLLGYRKDSIHFTHGIDKPLNADIIIIDESSMIDMSLFKKLCDAIDPKRSRLILLGDRNQLASVESGSVFGDLCADTRVINRFDEQLTAVLSQFGIHMDAARHPSIKHPLTHHIVELQESRRFNSQRGIGKFSKAILEHNEAEIRAFFDSENEEEISIFTGNSKEKIETFLRTQIEAYAAEKNIETALSRINQYKVICATRKGKYGVESLNALAEEYLKSRTELVASSPLYENQLIMVTQNQPELGIYNGDIGLIRYPTNESDAEQLAAFFPSSEQPYLQISPARITQWEPAFAITIHKSQGSEFEEVMICLPSDEGTMLLTRELIYTAITRAKHRALLIAEEDVLLQAAGNEVQRISGIRDRIATYSRSSA